MTANEKELYELVLALQAEISALKVLMVQSNPELAKEHQDLTDSCLEGLLAAWRRNRRDDLEAFEKQEPTRPKP